MAYASVISAKNTIERLVNSCNIPASREIIGLAHSELKSLQEILKSLDDSSKSSSRKRVNALDAQIREAVCNFENLLEAHVLDQINISREDVESFTESVKKMEGEYINELHHPLLEEEEEEARPLKLGVAGKMVGLSDVYAEVRDKLKIYWGFSVVALTGMAGIGKTRVVKELFQDPSVLSDFERCAWARVGRKCEVKGIIQSIAAQLDPGMDYRQGLGYAEWLKEVLKDKTCLVVLDDIWEKSVWDQLATGLPGNNYGRSRVLLTTRLQQVAEHATRTAYDARNTMRLLSKQESWDLLRQGVFGHHPCPPQLEKHGKKIAEICDGLPLMILLVAHYLSKADKTPHYWSQVANHHNSVFKNAYEDISEVLHPSYDYLPQLLKSFFLYVGVFPLNHNIPASQLINLWTAEGLLDSNIASTSEYEKCLTELVANSLLITCQISTNWWCLHLNYIKTCRLHSSFWYLCHKEAGRNKFFQALNRLVDASEQGLSNQRRLCFHNNVLFGIKEINNSIGDFCASTARALLCFGPYHQYQVPIYFGLRLLRVVDALQIRLYEFPVQVLKLVQLRYIALTCDGKLPASISKLWNLQFIIIHRHLNIKSCRVSCVPLEMWDMQELKHIEIMGSNLPDLNRGTSLRNLLTLLGVSAHNCSRGVVKRISKLKKLGIQIELACDDRDKSFGGLNRISRLRRLESLKCVLVNPNFGSLQVPVPISMFPSSLKKLHLSGLGFPWEHMSRIGALPQLEVLKLRCCAFRGPEWEVKDGFHVLRYLVIEDSDLVHWKVGRGSFSWLGCLSLKHCYKLRELIWDAYSIPKEVQVIECSPCAMRLPHQFKSKDHFGELKDVCIQSSWEDGNLNAGFPTRSKRDREIGAY